MFDNYNCTTTATDNYNYLDSFTAKDYLVANRLLSKEYPQNFNVM